MQKRQAPRSPAASPKRRRAPARSDSIPQLPPHVQAWLWNDSHVSSDLTEQVCKDSGYLPSGMAMEALPPSMREV